MYYSYLRAVAMARHKDFQVDKKRVNQVNLSKKCGTIKDVFTAFAQMMELTIPRKISHATLYICESIIMKLIIICNFRLYVFISTGSPVYVQFLLLHVSLFCFDILSMFMLCISKLWQPACILLVLPT